MGELFAPLADGQRDPIDDARLERIGARLKASDYTATTNGFAPVRLVLAGAVATMVVLLAALGLWLNTAPNTPDRLTLTNTGSQLPSSFEVPTDGEELSLSFSDSSEVVLSPSARLRVLQNEATSFELSLDRGRATFAVEPGGPRRWLIEAGLARIEVVGTRFVLDRTGSHLDVAVERGTVDVIGDSVPDGRRRLTSGDSLVLLIREESDETDESLATSDSEPPPSTRDEPGSEARESSDPEPGSMPAPRRVDPRDRVEWRPIARRGDFASAYEQLGATGLRREVAETSNIDDLFLLADVARRSGHAADAVTPLQRIMTEHRTDRRASVAAFTLGRIQLESLGRPSVAARTFARAIELGAPPALAEDARARLVEARSRAGDRAGAETAARDYLRRYPEGRLAPAVRRWSGLETP